MKGSKYKVISKDTYHMFALGEIVVRTGNARIYDTFTYANNRGIIQRLTDNQVEIVVDSEEEQA